MSLRVTSVTVTATCDWPYCTESAVGIGANESDAREAIRDHGFRLVRQAMRPFMRVYCAPCEVKRQSLIRAGVLDCAGRVLDSYAFGEYVDQIAKPEQVSA